MAKTIAVCGGFVVSVSLLAWFVLWLAPEVTSEALPDSRGNLKSDRAPVGFHSVSEWPEDNGVAFSEAPGLREKVDRGELPPVTKRLPENPLVIEPPEEIGNYGGNWTRFASGPQDIPIVMHQRLAYEGLVRWDAGGTEILPNLVTHWEEEDEGKSFVFYLRRGVRWSDGEAFSADDILFWYRDILLNRDVTPVVSPAWRPGGEVVEVEKIDDYTVRFSFAQTHGLFLEWLASGLGVDVVSRPAHYLKQFHAEHVPVEELMSEARQAGFATWHQYFADRSEWRNMARPRLDAWILTRPPPASRVVFSRNPYYWKVDPEGNQLPYIDQVRFQVVSTDMMALAATDGRMAMQHRHVEFQDYPLLMDRREQGGYRVLLWDSAWGGVLNLGLNMNHRDPEMAELFSDRRFRIALSHAIDRQLIREVGFFGMGVSRQLSPPEASPYRNEEYESAYIEYEPELAEELLDEIGLPVDEKTGMRTLPSGRPLRITIETTTMGGDIVLLQLIADNWRDIGIRAEVRPQGRELYIRRIHSVQHDVAVWHGADEQFPLIDSRWFFPSNTSSFQGVNYARWFLTQGEGGEKPPPEILRCMEWYWEIERTANPGRRMELFQKIVESNREHLWVIGTVGEVPALVVASDRMRNVPDRAMLGWIFRSPGNTAPECYSLVSDDEGG